MAGNLVHRSRHLMECLQSFVSLSSPAASFFVFFLLPQLLPSHSSVVFTSDLPRRSRLEMSTVSPLAAVSTPPVPLFCSLRFSRIFLKRGSYIIKSTDIKSFQDVTNITQICIYLLTTSLCPALPWWGWAGEYVHRPWAQCQGSRGR